MSGLRQLDAVDALGIVPRLCARHRDELLRTYPDLAKWALERVDLPGAQWALDVDGVVMAIGGVVDNGEAGYLWFAGAAGWEKHVVLVVKAVRSVADSAVFRKLTCQVYEDNAPAQRFAEYLGFQRVGMEGSLINYGMAR